MLHDLLCTIAPSSPCQESMCCQARRFKTVSGKIRVHPGKWDQYQKSAPRKVIQPARCSSWSYLGYPSLCAYRCVKVSLLLWDSAFSSGEPWASASTFMLSLVEIHGNVVPGNMTNTITKQHYLAHLLISQPHLELGRLPSCNCRIILTPTCVKYKLSNTWSLSTCKPASPRFDRFRRLQWQTSFHGEAWPFGAKELLETVPAARHGGKGMEWRRVTSDWK